MKRLKTIGMRKLHVIKLQVGRSVSKAKHKYYGWLWLFLTVALVLLVGGIAIASLLGY